MIVRIGTNRGEEERGTTMMNHVGTETHEMKESLWISVEEILKNGDVMAKGGVLLMNLWTCRAEIPENVEMIEKLIWTDKHADPALTHPVQLILVRIPLLRMKCHLDVDQGENLEPLRLSILRIQWI